MKIYFLRIISCNKIILLFAGLFFFIQLKAQPHNFKLLYDSLDKIDYDSNLSIKERTQRFNSIEKLLIKLSHTNDSVYAKVLNKIGKYKYHYEKDYNQALFYTEKALRINMTYSSGASKEDGLISFFNMGYYYEKLEFLDKSLDYFDSTILMTKKYNGPVDYIPEVQAHKAYIYFVKGDFQKSIDEANTGFAIARKISDDFLILLNLNQRGQSNFFQGYNQEALSDINQAIDISIRIKIPRETASAFKIKGFIYAQERNFREAENFFLKGINARFITGDSGQIAGDFIDIANFYRDSVAKPSLSFDYYKKGLFFANAVKDSIRLSRIHDNLGLTYTMIGNYKEAEKCFIKSMSYLRLPATLPLSNPSAAAFSLIGNKELILDILMNKSALLLAQYKKSNQQSYLNACLQTALLSDSVITDTRHEQFGEQSKLYWRNRTRSFYTDAMEAAYLSQNIPYAFYFMEKSRAVLLNDRLNELGARAQLSPSAVAQNQQLQLEYLKQQAVLNQLNPQSAAYTDQVTKVIYAKEKLELFIKSLEKENPLYYQYKYADVVPSLQEMQKYLAAGKQSFVQYFINDTVAYVLTITSASTSFIKLSSKKFNQQMLVNFLQSCTNKKLLQNNYDAFAKQSYNLYQTIFQQLKIPAGRTIICPDNVLTPFEALCTDTTGKNFLINQYTFSYVYSARYLLMPVSNIKPRANFAGFAPVHFQSSLGVVDLRQSEESLKNSKSFYNSAALFTKQDASKNNFMNHLADYTVVAVLSHAKADDSGTEPVLYMQDSMIHLSELNMLKNVSAKLVMLSACQTNVGQNATGEGVYSLARGFAAAGIPALSATLWEADEQTVYILTEKMNEYLSQGNTKDDALAKAKRFFLHDNTSETTLPYYWANMILIGNPESLQFSSASNTWWWAAGIAMLAAFAAIWFFAKRKTVK